MHVLTSFVGKNDPLVRERPDRRLLSDAEAVLATDIDEVSREIAARDSLAPFPDAGTYGVSRDVRIDDEIIHYEAAGGASLAMLLQCVRGFAGTKAARHRAGAAIHHLAEREGCYLADLRTTLKDEIAERIASLLERSGFGMIYFDGGEVNCINGPCWYWAGQQQAGVLSRVKRDLLIQGSGITHWTRHYFARGTCDDFAAVAPKQYLDNHKIRDEWRFYNGNFLPAELGWWGIVASAADRPATTPDEAEHYAVRMLALDSPVSLETTLASLKENGRNGEMIGLLGEYERLRLGDVVPLSLRDRLRSGEWRMVRRGGRPAFSPISYATQRVDLPGEPTVRNEFDTQRFKFRLQAVPGLANAGDRANMILLRAGSALAMNPQGPDAAMPGALAGRIEFATGAGNRSGAIPIVRGAGAVPEGKAVDLSRHRALAVTLRADGPSPKRGDPVAVLNIQMESRGRTYRDYYLDLDFTGERTIIVPEPGTERMLPEFRPAHENYAFKSAMSGFTYHDVVAVNLRRMRQPKTAAAACTIIELEALAERGSLIRNPEISIGNETITLPVTLRTGEYVELLDDGPARVFDRNGVQLSVASLGERPVLPAGETRMVLRSDGRASARLTTIVQGNALAF